MDNRVFTLLAIAGLTVGPPTIIATTIEPVSAQTAKAQEFAQLDLYTSEYRNSTSNGQTTHSVKLNLRNRTNAPRLLTSIERAEIREIEIIDAINRSYSVVQVEEPDELLYKPFRGIVTVPLQFITPMGIRATKLRITTVKGDPIEIRL